MSRPWMPFYVADYLADTAHLSTVEHGAYLLLIMHYWQKGGLPADDRRLASIARATLEQWADIRSTIAEFFDTDWRHHRIDAELDRARVSYEKRALAGQRGGKAKAAGKQSSSNASSNGTAKDLAGLYQPESQPQLNSYPASQHSYGDAARDDVVSARLGDMLTAIGISDETKLPGFMSMAEPLRWVAAGCEVDADILPALRMVAARGKVPRSWSYCSDAVFEHRDRRLAPAPIPQQRSGAPPVRPNSAAAALEAYLENLRNEPERSEGSQGEGREQAA